jgi:hypothetical protein
MARLPSLEMALRSLVPALAPNLSFEIYPSTGKQNLLGILPARLRGYASWLPADWRILIAVDRDDDNCIALKQQLDEIARTAGMTTRSEGVPQGQPFAVVNRIIVEELEAWFFGDWGAVREAYPRVNAQVPAKASFRNPDQIAGGTWEALERVLKRAGYFGGGLRKIEFAQSVAPLMDPQRNQSKSFQVFAEAVRECAV